MKLTMGEFCQFGTNTRVELLKEFGKYVLEKEVDMILISVYRVFGFYVEVYENLTNQKVEKVEPLRNMQFLELYNTL